MPRENTMEEITEVDRLFRNLNWESHNRRRSIVKRGSIEYTLRESVDRYQWWETET